MNVLWRAILFSGTLLVASSLPASGPPRWAIAQDATSGKVLASTRGQVAWLNLVAPRPTLLTQLERPAFPADVAAAPDVSFAVASVISAFRSGDALAMGGDLLTVDLQSGATRVLLSRQTYTDSLDMPVFWPDGTTIVYQRSNLRAQVDMPGQAQAQYQSQLERIGLDGSGPVLVLDDARYPAPAPDGSHLAFVRSGDRGTGIFVHSLADGSNQELVKPGQFLAIAYPRYSPDGRQLAFAAISPLSPIGTSFPIARLPGLTDALVTRAAAAHGFPWDVWLVNADGSNLRQLADVADDDPSVAWSPDGAQLLVYGGWGSYLVDVASGTAVAVPHLAGYGSVAWLPN